MEAGKKVIIYEKFQIENDKLLFFMACFTIILG